MKNKLLFLLLICTGIGFTCCNSNKTNISDNCIVNVKIGIPQYTTAYLLNDNDQTLDTLDITNMTISFERNDTASMPYIAVIRLSNPTDSIDILSMPVIIEPGEININISEYITVQGTNLNLRLQEFLNGLQATHDSIKLMKDIQVEKIKTKFSEFYRQQILMNKDNVLGKYIYKSYGIHLTETDNSLVNAQLTTD